MNIAMILPAQGSILSYFCHIFVEVVQALEKKEKKHPNVFPRVGMFGFTGEMPKAGRHTY